MNKTPIQYAVFSQNKSHAFHCFYFAFLVFISSLLSLHLFIFLVFTSSLLSVHLLCAVSHNPPFSIFFLFISYVQCLINLHHSLSPPYFHSVSYQSLFMDLDPEQSQHLYPYERKERIFYTGAGTVFTVGGALLIMSSRFVQIFVAPKPIDPTALPSITVVNPNQLFHHHLSFLVGRWVHAALNMDQRMPSQGLW